MPASVKTAIIYRIWPSFNSNPAFQTNAASKLNITSAYGDNEAYHPKVVNFDKQWHGFKYWMAYTPYPHADDLKENPHIKASNNLIDWETPAGLRNPIDEPSSPAHLVRYNSDTHLLYNDDLNRLELFWRYVDDSVGSVTIYQSVSYDGIHWSKKSVFVKSSSRVLHDYVSPAIIYENGVYKFWSVHANKVEYYEIVGGLNWSAPQILDISYPDGSKTWHLDVVEENGGYGMVTVAYPSWDKHNYMSMYYSKSIDGIRWKNMTRILNPSHQKGAWDEQGLYRSTYIYDGGVFYLFYSGMNAKEKGVGIALGKSMYSLKGTNIDFINDPDAANKFSILVDSIK